MQQLCLQRSDCKAQQLRPSPIALSCVHQSFRFRQLLTAHCICNSLGRCPDTRVFPPLDTVAVTTLTRPYGVDYLLPDSCQCGAQHRQKDHKLHRQRIYKIEFWKNKLASQPLTYRPTYHRQWTVDTNRARQPAEHRASTCWSSEGQTRCHEDPWRQKQRAQADALAKVCTQRQRGHSGAGLLARRR